MDKATCAVCCKLIEIDLASLHRELPVCRHCGSCPRFCGIALAVSKAVYGDHADVALRDRPRRRDISALGFSDDERLAGIFADKFSYANTFFHTEPKLDLCSRSSCSDHFVDLIVCSEVLEHTLAPPIVPLTNLFSMLKPNGTLVLSAPTFLFDATVEWYGGMRALEIADHGGDHVVRWRNRRGIEYVDPSPVFHGGPGQVLEFRMIAHSELLVIARGVGFVGNTFEFVPEWGYAWPIVEHFSYADAACDSRILVLQRPA